MLTSQIYQITAHKIQILDKSDQVVEQQLVPQLPGGKTDDNKNTKARKMEGLVTTFSMKKKSQDGHQISSRLGPLSDMYYI